MSGQPCGCDGDHKCDQHRDADYRCEAGHWLRHAWCPACQALVKRQQPIVDNNSERV